MLPIWVRRPPLRGYGQATVATLCAYELAALPEWSPLPTITSIVRRHWWVGALLLVEGFHHFYIEQDTEVPLLLTA